MIISFLTRHLQQARRRTSVLRSIHHRGVEEDGVPLGYIRLRLVRVDALFQPFLTGARFRHFFVARVEPRTTSRAGDTIKVAFDTSRCHIFDKDTERCICH